MAHVVTFKSIMTRRVYLRRLSAVLYAAAAGKKLRLIQNPDYSVSFSWSHSVLSTRCFFSSDRRSGTRFYVHVNHQRDIYVLFHSHSWSCRHWRFFINMHIGWSVHEYKILTILCVELLDRTVSRQNSRYLIIPLVSDVYLGPR